MRRCTSDNNLGGSLIVDIVISCAATYFAATIFTSGKSPPIASDESAPVSTRSADVAAGCTKMVS